MTAQEVIRRLQESSGRYDLLTSDWLYAMNRASRSLDSKTTTKHSHARSFAQLAEGDTRVSIEDLRALEEVWLHTSTTKVKCDLSLNTLGQMREAQGYTDVQTEVMNMLGLEPETLSIYGRVLCVETVERVARTLTDTTVVARVNLTNAALTVASSPPTATELSILIEDGLLYPQNPANDITAGTVTIVGTDYTGAALTEIVDCSRGAGIYTTTYRFKTVTSVTAAAFNYLTTDDEKITVTSGRLEFLQDSGTSYSASTLLFYPAVTAASTVEVIGLFWSKTLSAITDTNFWTDQYPDALMYEVARALEIPLRNREGQRDWEYALAGIIQDINNEYIQTLESTQTNTMRG